MASAQQTEQAILEKLTLLSVSTLLSLYPYSYEHPMLLIKLPFTYPSQYFPHTFVYF